MTPFFLLKSLAEELREATKDYKFVAQYQPPKKVSVYVQNVPTEEFENNSFYPLIAIELLGVEDDVELSVASVLITIGTYNGESSDGYKDHLNLLEMVRQYLLKHPIIGKKFSAIMPMYTGLVEKCSDDFRYSNIFLQYQIASPTRSFADDFLYGSDKIGV